MKCSKRPATDSVAEVKIHAARVRWRNSRNGSATSSGVDASTKPRSKASYQCTQPGSAAHAQFGEARVQVLGARVARIQALAALGQRGQCRRGAFQCLRQRLERAIDRVALAHARPRTALAVALQRQAQVAHGRLDRRAQRRQRGLGPGLGGGLAQRVLLELDQLARGHACG